MYNKKIELINNMYDLKIFTDGGARGNPGPSACGVIIFDNKNKIKYIDGFYIGVATNNQAEYLALESALKKATEISNGNIECYLDSELIVRQLKGIYKIKNKNLIPIFDNIKILIKNFKECEFTHVPREQNKIADKLVNIILDAIMKKS